MAHKNRKEFLVITNRKDGLKPIQEIMRTQELFQYITQLNSMLPASKFNEEKELIDSITIKPYNRK